MSVSTINSLKFNRHRVARVLVLSIACWLIQLITPHVCYGASASNPADVTGMLDIPHAIHLIGLGDLKANIPGDLKIDRKNLTFVTAGAATEISIKSIFAFTIEQNTVPLIKGTAGHIVGFTPYGAGQAISMVRTAVDTLSLVYRDKDDAIHGTVLLVKRGQGQEVMRALAASGLAPREYPRSRAIEPVRPLTKAQLRALDSSIHARPAIKVVLVTETAAGVPAAFPVAIYEELISRLGNTGMFSKIWRDGDTRLPPNVLTLDVDITQFKKGNERTRSLIPFWGSTVLKTDLKLKNSGGNVLLDRNVSDSINFHGENMSAGHDFCKKVEKELKKLPELNDPKPNYD